MRRLEEKNPSAHTRDLAASVMLRISALHALILALVFAQEMAQYQQLKLQSAAEANALADIYFDAGRYGEAADANISQPIRQYVELVINEEWDSLGGDGKLASSAWDRWNTAYERILNLEPASDRQRSLRDHMLTSVHTIAATRVQREHHARNALSAMFWFAAVSGVIFTGLAFYPYTPPAEQSDPSRPAGGIHRNHPLLHLRVFEPVQGTRRTGAQWLPPPHGPVRSGGGPYTHSVKLGAKVPAARLLHGALQVDACHHSPGMCRRVALQPAPERLVAQHRAQVIHE